MSTSAGGLYLPVKLDITQAQAQLVELGKAWANVFKDQRLDTAAFRLMRAQVQSLEIQYQRIAKLVQAVNTTNEAAVKIEQARAQAAKNTTTQYGRQRDEVNKVAADLSKMSGKGFDTGMMGSLRRDVQFDDDRGAAATAFAAWGAKASRDQVAAANASWKAQQQAADATKIATAALAGQAIAQTRATAAARQSVPALQAQAAATRQVASAAHGAGGAFSIFSTSAEGAVGTLASLRAGPAFGAYVGMKNLGSVVSAVKTGMAGASTAAVGFAAAAAAVAVAAGAAAAGIGLIAKNMVQMGTQSAINLQMMEVQFTGLMGSSERAAKEYQFLLDLGKESIIPTDVLIAADRTLYRFGVTADGTRQQVVKLFSDMGAAGATAEELDRLAYAIGQVAAYGKVNLIDIRQFANAGLSADKLAAGLGITTQKLLELTSEGQFSAEMLFTALEQLGPEYQKLGELAQTTVTGLWGNIQDLVKTNMLGDVFKDAGVPEQIAAFLAKIKGWLEANADLFKPLAESAQRFFQAIGSAAQTAMQTGGTSLLQWFFQRVLPGAIDFATRAVLWFRDAWARVGPVVIGYVKAMFGWIKMFIEMFRAWWPTLMPLLKAFAVGFLASMTAAIIASRIFQSVVITTIRLVQALVSVIRGNMAGAFKSVKSAVDTMKSGINDSKDAVKAFNTALKGVKTSPLLKPLKTPKVTGGGGGGPVGGGDDTSKDKGGGGGPSAAAQKMASALAQLYDMTIRWLGRASDLEESLFGVGKAFTASAEGIVNTGKQLAKILSEGLTGTTRDTVTAFLTDQINSLEALAKRRDELTKQLEDTQKRLDDLVREQSDFAANISKGLLAFARALNQSETVKDFQKLDAIGSFMITERKGGKDFAKQMEERAASIKKFIDNIRALQSRGLDPTLVKEFVSAGPEAAGEVVAQLAGANDATIAQVNSTNQDLIGLAEEFGVEQAGVFYDNGVAALKAEVAGLESQIATVENAARNITAVIYAEMAKWAQPARDAGEAIGSGVGSGMAAGMGASLPLAEEEFGNTVDSLDVYGDELVAAMKQDAYDAGSGASFNLKDTLGRIPGWLLEQAIKIKAIGIWDSILSSLPTYDQLVLGLSIISAAFKAVINKIIDYWNKLDLKISVPVLGFTIGDIVPDIPKLAKGGVVTRPTLALVGEAGPEAIVPLSPKMATGYGALGSGGDVQVRVFIGETELTGIVRTEVRRSEQEQAFGAAAGRRLHGAS